MTTPKPHNKVQEASRAGTEVSQCSDKDFKVVVFRKLNGIQENRMT